MPMNIDHFNHLLEAARAQPLAQHLLLVFVQVELPDDASAEQRASFEAGEGGALVPFMCVDKSAHELQSFQDLCDEATALGNAWRFVFAAALSGSVGTAPATEAVDKALQTMVEHIQQGALGNYLAFDRQGRAVALGQ